MSFQLVPAAYVILRRADGRVLLQLRSGTAYMDGHWACAAAGHVESGESVLAAARREAAEELGIEVDEADLTPVCVVHRHAGTERPIDQRVDFFFECRRWRGEPKLVESHRAAELRWVRLDALPEPVVPHERAVLDRLDVAAPSIRTFGF